MNILLIVYKIAPNRGSEDCTGYHLTKALMQKGMNITLITRSNNIDTLKNDPDFAGIDMIGVDVPKWLGFFKKKERGIILYYYLWQMTVGLIVRRLQKTTSFDVIHQLNFHSTWAPHFIFSKKTKIIWGPLTHHQSVSRKLWFRPVMSYYFSELPKNIAKAVFRYFDPFLFWAVKRSHTILYSAQHVVWPYSLARDKLKIMSYGGSAFPTVTKRDLPSHFNILFVGRFVNLKGCVTAMSAIREFCKNVSHQHRNHISVTIIGDGPLYTDMAAQSQIITSASEVRVELLPWIDQADLADYYRQAAIFIYPSFEGQGLVVAEALSQGCPVLCFKKTGPHDLADIAAVTVSSSGSASAIVTSFASHLEKLFNEFMHQPDQYAKRIEAAMIRGNETDWSRTADKIIEAYRG